MLWESISLYILAKMICHDALLSSQDVPGLIAGAAQGVGLGHAFLRHVERCHVILHLIDATSNDPIADLKMLNRELVNYGTGQLGRMPQVVVVNKIDALEGRGEDWESGLKTKLTNCFSSDLLNCCGLPPAAESSPLQSGFSELLVCVISVI